MLAQTKELWLELCELDANRHSDSDGPKQDVREDCSVREYLAN